MRLTDVTSKSPLPWLRSGRIPSLDGLRAIAVLLVLLSHVHGTRGFPDVRVLHLIARKGSIGVDVFFVISGFLITILMLRERSRTGRLDVRKFYSRRILRIVPAYVSFLLVVAILQTTGLVRVSVRDWAAATTYTVNFLRRPAWEIGHAWSLSVEEHFYLAWPFLMGTAARFGARAAVGCMAFCFTARWVILLGFSGYSPMAELWTFTRIDSIATGCLLAFLAWDVAWRARLERFCSSGWTIAAAGATLVGSLAASGYSAKFAVGIAYSLNAVCIALLIWAAISQGGTRIGIFLNARGLRVVGIASYSLYLWQQIFLNPHSNGLLCAFPLNLILASGAAVGSYCLVERPFLRLKQKYELNETWERDGYNAGDGIASDP